MNCPRCGAVNQDGARNCTHCGCLIPITPKERATDKLQEQGSYARALPGFRAGVFPREHIIDGEKIQWEGKPALIDYILSPMIDVIGGALWYVILSTVENPFPAPLSWMMNLLKDLGLLIIILGLVGVLYGYIRWKKTSFALTNRRVLTQYGVFTTKFADCAYDKIQNTVVIKPFFDNLLGYGDLVFATAGFRGGINSASANKFMANGGGVYWNALPSPVDVKRYTETFIETSKKEAKKQEYGLIANILNNGGTSNIEEISASTNGGQDVGESAQIEKRLAKAKQLREREIVTQEEYEQLRRKILDGV